jgi:hypothetical protein
MSKSQTSREQLCGNCRHFVAGGLCELVMGQINSKSTCDLHEFGSPKPIDTEVNPTHTKTKTNYKPGFMVETIPTTGDIAQNAIQMEHELLARGIPENEVHRAVIAYFSQREPPAAMPWPGPVTGVDLAGNVNNVIVPDTGTPLTNFNGLPADTQPYPTPNKSPYGIGSNPYPSNPTPDPNSVGSVSNTYNISNPPYPYESAVWNGLGSNVNSQPSMHGEYGFNVASLVPTFPNDYEALHSDTRVNSKGIQPSGAVTEAKKENQKKKYQKLLAKWALLIGGAVAIDHIIKNYIDSDTEQPLQVFAEYQYHGHDSDDECAKFSKKTFDLLETHNRPVIPSEDIGYTTTHPNCICTWKVLPNYTGKGNSLSRKEESDIHSIESYISKAAKDGTLHKIDKDGKLATKTTKKNPLKELCDCMNVRIPSISLDLPARAKVGMSWPKRKAALQEAISNLRSEFDWLTDDYILKAKELAEEAEGQLYLIRAAGESVTDHRSEGEPYRRKLSADELNSMTRTIIGKSMDINHQPEYETQATILDAEFDKSRKEIQTLVIERDHQIIDAIKDKKITAVSINGGMPRSESVEKCNHDCAGDSCELCVVPKGVVLGESDGIGMTWVITDPNGLYWNGHFVSSAEPGIKFTRIETL